jgi:FtsH-binding integral membrane protein
MDEEALKSSLRVLLAIYSLYVCWCLFTGRVYLPAMRPWENRNAIERQTSPFIFWVVWLAYFALWVFVTVKAVL